MNLNTYINSLFPHQVIEVCRKVDAKLIQISTDCVFYGDKGEYSELDTPDAKDLYGRSKALGEIDNLHDITIRTSKIFFEKKIPLASPNHNFFNIWY